MNIRESVVERIVAHARADAPIEACGYLMGSEDVITRAVSV